MEDTTPTTTTTTTLHLGPQWARQGGSLAQMMKNSNEVSEAPPQKTKTFIRPPVYDKEKMLSCHRDVGVPEGMNLIEGVTTKECLPPVSLTVLTSEQRNAFWSRRRPRGKSGEGQGLRKTTTTTTGGGMDGRWSSKETVSSRWGGEQRERRPWTPGSVEAKSSRGKNELWEDAGTRESASSSLEKMAKQAQEFEAMKAAAKAKMKAEKAARSTMTTSNETTTIPTPVLFGDRSPVSPVVTQLAPVPHENAWSSALNKHQHEQQQWSQATRSRPAPATQQQQQQPSWTGNTSTTTTSSNAWGASTRQQQQQSVVPRPHHHQQQQQPLRQQPITTTYASQRQEPPRVIQQQQQWQQQQQQQQYSRSSPTPPTLPIPLDMNTPQWWYQDPHGRTQGPFPGMKMIEWVRQGFFKRDLPVRFRNHTEFRPLGVLFPNNQTMFTHVPESIVQQQSNTRRRGSPSLSPKLHSQQPPQQSLPSKATWGTTSSSSSSTTKKTNADTRTLMSALHIEPKQQQQDAALHAAFVATSAQISAQNVVRTLPAQNVTTKQMQQQAWNNEKKKQPTMVDIQREERRRAAMEAKRLEEERAKRQQEQQKQPSTNASPWGMKKQAPKVKSFMEIQAEEEKRELAMRKARQNEAMESSRRTQGQTMAQRLGSNSSRANLQKWTTGAAPTTEQQASVQIQNKKTLIPATTKPAVKSLMEVQAEQLKEQKERRPRRGNAASWSNITSSSSSNSQSQQKTGWNRDATRTAPQETKSLLEIQAEEARKRASSRQQGGPSRNSWLQAAGGSESRQGISSSSSTTIETSQSNSGSVGVDSFWNGVLTESGDVKSTTEIRSTRTTSSHSYTDTNRKSAKDRRGRNNTRQSSGNRHQNMNKNTTTSSTTTSENQSLSSSASTSSKSNSSKKKGSEDFGSKMPRSMVSWCKSQLSKITNSDDETLVRFCFTLDSPADIREYMRNYMGSTPQVSAFASEFIRRKNRSKGRSSGSNNNNKSTNSTSRRGGRRGRGGRGGRGGRRK